MVTVSRYHQLHKMILTRMVKKGIERGLMNFDSRYEHHRIATSALNFYGQLKLFFFKWNLH